MKITLGVVINENNVNHQIDIEMEPIIYSENGENKIVWRSMDAKYRLQIWKYENENQVKPENVDKDSNIVSSAVEIAGQINRLKLEEI